MESKNQHQSPYVGPRPFERRHIDIFFGRDKETSELLSFVSTHQLVLFYAQSGIGKTSLLNAGLIPLLEQEEFEIFPVARVRGLIPDHIPYEFVKNPYVLNTLISWVSQDTDPGSLLHMSINDFLRDRLHLRDRSGFELPRVAIFDQFEELFSFYPDRWKQREDFFRQLSEALAQDDLFRVIFVMREDFIAQIDPYTHLLPDRLRSRFRLEPMSPQAALPAVIQPVKNTERAFAPGVAEQLVHELTQMRVEIQDGKTQTITGEAVEPVQLQVVCQNLWQRLPADVQVINHQHLEEFGDVDEALSKFYEDSIALAVAETDVTEKQLRDWFQNVLITSAKTRGTVYQDAHETGGIPNTAVRVLENQHIVRAEMRAGGRWYELNHDRFIEPILNSNEAWGAKHIEAAQQAREGQLRQWSQRLQRILVFGGILALILLSGLTIYSFQQRNEALAAQQEAIVQANIAGTQAANATIAQGEAIIQADNAATEAANATIAQGEAINQANNAATEAANATIAQGEAILQAYNAATEAANAENSAATATYAQGEAIVQLNNAGTEAVNAANSAATADAAQAARLQQARNEASTREADSATREADNATQIAELENSRERADDAANNAATQAALAENNALFAQSVSLSNNSLMALTNGNPELALVLAREANEFPVTAPIAYQALFDAVTLSYIQQRFTGHSAAVSAVDVSANNQFIVSGSSDTTLIIWDITAGTPIRTLSGHEAGVTAVKFSPDGTLIVSGDLNGQVIIWDARTGEIVRQFTADDSDTPLINAVDFSPDGRYFLTSTLYTITQWDTATGDELRTIESDEFIATMRHGVRENTVLIGGGFFEGETLVGLVWLVDFSGSRDETVFSGQTPSYVLSLDIDVTGNQIVTGEDSGDIRLWNVQAGTSINSRQYAQSVYTVMFSPDNRYIFSASWGTQPLLWDTATLTVVRTLSGESTGVLAADFTEDGRFVVSGSDDTTLIQWDVQTYNLVAIYAGHNDAVGPVQYHPDGNSFISASYDGRIIQWNTSTHEIIREFDEHIGGVYSVKFSPDGSQILSGGGIGEIFLWDTEQGEVIHRYKTNASNILAVDMSADGRYVAAGGDNTVSVWDRETGEFIATSSHHTDVVWSVKFSPDGNYIVSASSDRTLVIWDWRDNVVMHRLEGHLQRVNAVDVSPDGSLIASAAGDGLVILWDMASGEQIRTLRGHRNFVNDVVFSPDGQTLLSGSDDKTVMWWDVATGLPLRRFTGHNSWILGVTFSPDGTRALSGSDDMSVMEWYLAPYPQMSSASEDTSVGERSLDPFTRGLLAWSEVNRSIAELTCADRDLYEVHERCAAGVAVPTRTPFPTLEPTATFTPSPTMSVAQVTPTLTATARATASPDAQVASVLDDLGIPQSSGYQAEFVDEILVDLTGEDDLIRYETLDGVYTDFVMGATVTWGPGATEDECGFVLRRSEARGSYYSLEMDQLSNLDFTPRINNEWLDTENVGSDVTEIGEGNTNYLVVIGIDDQFTVYINNQQVAQFVDASLTEGELGVLAGTSDESDETFCTFNDIWVWDFVSAQAPLPTATPDDTVQTALETMGVNVKSGYQVSTINQLVLDIEGEEGSTSLQTLVGIYDDFAMGASISWGAGSSTNECGFAFRVGETSYYTIRINREGSMRVRPLFDDGYETLLETTFAHIDGRASASNELWVAAIGDEFTIYINGEYAGEFTDSQLPEGEVGVFGAGYDKIVDTSCTFDDFWLWEFTSQGPIQTPLPPRTPEPSLPPSVVLNLAMADIQPGDGTLAGELDTVAFDDTSNFAYFDGEYANFVLHTNIEMSDQIGCGFSLRDSADGAYLLLVDDSGYVSLVDLLPDDVAILDATLTPVVNLRRESEFELMLVVEDSTFRVFVNDEQVAEFEDDRYAQGRAALISVTDSEDGCTFTDNWLFELR